MNTTSHMQLASHLQSGRVYRREALLSFSRAIDRDLKILTSKQVLKKVAPSLYYKPAVSRFGLLPPNEKQLVEEFLRDSSFLLYSWNQYNSLGLGLTQLYNGVVVYNRKRHGVFKLAGKTFNFRRPSRGFPAKITAEFLLVDLTNNLNELAEDSAFVKQQIKNNISKFNAEKLAVNVERFGKIATKKFFEDMNY